MLSDWREIIYTAFHFISLLTAVSETPGVVSDREVSGWHLFRAVLEIKQIICFTAILTMALTTHKLQFADLKKQSIAKT